MTMKKSEKKKKKDAKKERQIEFNGICRFVDN